MWEKVCANCEQRCYNKTELYEANVTKYQESEEKDMHKKRIFKFFRATLCTTLAFSMIFGDLGASLGIAYAKESVREQETGYEEEAQVTEEAVDSAASQHGLADNTKDGVILHAFCWSFKTIQENMKDIAEAGYTTVQTSPANACNDSHPQMKLYSDENGTGGCWWWHYQPTDWTIGNYQLGTADDYKAMCEEADKYGIKIITDVIPNHTTPDLQRVAPALAATGGGLGAGQLYHSNGFKGIEDRGEWTWGNRLACTTGMMGGLPDVNTENQAFQAYYLKYCNDLIDLGCDGFRYDTAKHIGVPDDPKDPSNTRGVNDFWDVATGKKAVNGVNLKNADQMFIYGEVLQGDNVPTQTYASYMYQTASNYGGTLRDAIKNQDFSTGKISNWSHSNPERVVSWVESHDTYCNAHESGWLTDWQIRMAWAIIAARKDGVPLWMSRPEGSNGSSGNYWGNNVLGAKGNDQFKDPEVVAVNFFRNAMAGEGETLRNPNGNNKILQIDRGSKGTCIINLGGETQINNATTMTDGTYKDQVSGREFTVSGGQISGKLDGGKIAVIYNAGTINRGAGVTASVADGKSFTEDSIDVTFTVTNAVSATYSVNGEAATDFTDKVKLTLGAGLDYGPITVVITAKGEEGEPVTKKFTYTKKEAGKVEKNTIYFTKPSGWSTPKIYAYTDGSPVTKLTGEWPGTALTDAGDGVYTYTFSDSVSAAKVIFTDGTNQDPTDTPGQSCGYDYVSGKAYTYEGGTWTAVSVSTATNTPKPTNTSKPTVTNTPTPTEDGSLISVDFANGSEFTTETKTVNIKAANNAKGTYSVDNGPVKEFTGKAAVVIGKGKIANTDVTLNVSVGDENKVYTYKKVFSAEVSEAKANAADTEETVEEAKVNTAAESGGMYATNPGGAVGKRATITIDGSFSDWSEDMLIAQGGAWDIANNWKGGHENCVLDDYALYAAWDSDNLYIGWQMVNTTDTWANPGDGPLSDGGRVLDVPLMLAINVGNRPAMTGMMANGKLIWDALDVQFETRVDNILLMSGKAGLGTPGYFIASDESGGASYDPEYCLSFKNEGISYKMAEGCLPSTIMGLVGSTSPEDAYDASKYQAVTGHDNKYDSFYEINIPLKTLGIDEAYITEHGIGVMQIATRGTSAIDCIPHDPSMLDNALGDCAVDPSTSHEKDDTDIITVPLASVGKLQNGGEVTIAPTRKPTVTPTTAAATVTPTPTTVPAGLSVNFGADRSAPQYTTTELTVKAEVTGATGSCNYEFFVDGTSVQNSAKDTYTWKNDAAGAHTIKVVVTDSKGNSKTIEKEYDLEANGEDTPTPVPENTVTPTPTTEAGPTDTPTPQPTQSASQLTITGFTVSSSGTTGQYKVGDRFTLKAKTQGADGTPFYMFTYIVNGEEVIIKNYGIEDEASFIADQAGTYSFKVYVVDSSNYANPEFETGGVVVAENPDGPDVTIAPDISDTPIITDAPTATVTVKPTLTPTRKPTATPRAATPTPTKKPTATVKPTRKPTATPKPTRKPTPTTSAGTAPRPGTVVVIEEEEADFTIIASGRKKTVEYTSYQGTEPEVIIPSEIEINDEIYKVTSIANSAFKNNKKIKSVMIESGITKIGNSAFYGCKNLRKVTGGSSLQVIGDKAFYRCTSLKSMTMRTRLTSIGKYAFYKCTSLKKITIPSKVTKIGTKAFYGCKNLKTISIKTRKLTNSRVGSSAFKGTYKKATVKVPGSKVNSYKKMLKKKGLSSQAKVRK